MNECIGEERYISQAEEFQIIYGNTPPSGRWSITLLSSAWVVHSDFLPQNTLWEGEKGG